MKSVQSNLVNIEAIRCLVNIEAIRWNAFYNAAHTMTHKGSDFAGAIAEAYYKADKANKAKLEDAFLDIFTHYMDASDRELFRK